MTSSPPTPPPVPWQVAIQNLITSLRTPPSNDSRLALLILLLQTLQLVGRGNVIQAQQARTYIGDVQQQWGTIDPSLLNEPRRQSYHTFVTEFNRAFPQPQSKCKPV